VFRNPANIPDGVKADHENSLSQHY
jgi:hypothetical protein